MPRLYSIIRDFDSKNPNYDPKQFFPSANYGRHWSGSESSWKFDLNKDFPASSFIHRDDMEELDNSFWIALRKDVERRYQGDCFYVYDCRDYRRWWNSKAKNEWDREYETQRHGYWTFYFEEEGDQAMFILQHGSLLAPKKYRFHPYYGINCQDKRYDVPDDEEIPEAWRV